MAKTENNAIVHVNERGSETTNRQLVLDGPSDKGLLMGTTIQGTALEIGNMAMSDFRRVIHANIRNVNKEDKAAKEKAAQTKKDYHDAVARLRPPRDYLGDLRVVCDAVRKFHPKAVVPKFVSDSVVSTDADDAVDDDKEVDGGKIGISCTLTTRMFKVSGAIESRGRTLFMCDREYAFPSELVKLLEATIVADKGVEATQNRLLELSRELSRLDEVREETAAAVTRYNLRNSGPASDGLMSAVAKNLLERAKESGLSIPQEEQA